MSQDPRVIAKLLNDMGRTSAEWTQRIMPVLKKRASMAEVKPLHPGNRRTMIGGDTLNRELTIPLEVLEDHITPLDTPLALLEFLAPFVCNDVEYWLEEFEISGPVNLAIVMHRIHADFLHDYVPFMSEAEPSPTLVVQFRMYLFRDSYSQERTSPRS